MARIIGGNAPTATSGERRLARRLGSHLEDDYLCWWDVPIGKKYVHPDFIILHPRRGLLILEVKDWKLDNIHSIDPVSVGLLTQSGLKQVQHPLQQARGYTLSLKQTLERDPALVSPPDHAFAGKLSFPYGYGVVLSEITRTQFEATDLRDAIPADRVLFKDDLMPSVDAEAFQERLWNMFDARFDALLTMPQIDRIRWHIFPEVRVTQGSLLPDESDGSPPSEAALMRVMDLKQEQLARGLGEGHRIIHGAAGSGKTLILGYRCERLARTTQRPILVLCYNVALAAKLDQMIRSRGLEPRVVVRSFHKWCTDQLELYHVTKPTSGDDFFDRLVTAVISAVDRGAIPRGQYGALLVDEGHDFEPEWLKLIVQMVDPQTNSLLLLYDDAQAIYGGPKRKKFSFKGVGIQAQGRTTILQINYRNTNEILDCAYQFAKDVLTPAEAEDDGIPLIEPEMAGRHGPPPELLIGRSLLDEGRTIAESLAALHRTGLHWNQMAILYPASFVAHEVMKVLDDARIPYEWLQRDKASRRYNASHDSVKVLTIQSSKGLEFKIVAIAGVGTMPYKNAEAEARLLYVGMTRATERLFMTASKQSSFVARLSRWRSGFAGASG